MKPGNSVLFWFHVRTEQNRTWNQYLWDEIRFFFCEMRQNQIFILWNETESNSYFMKWNKIKFSFCEMKWDQIFFHEMKQNKKWKQLLWNEIKFLWDKIFHSDSLVSLLMTCCTKIQNSKFFLISVQFQCHIFLNVRATYQHFVFQKHQSNHDIFQIQIIMNQHIILIQELSQYLLSWLWISCDLVFM